MGAPPDVNLAYLNELTELRKIDLSNTHPLNRWSIAHLPKLETLILQGAGLKNLGFLRGHATLRSLDVGGNELTSLEDIVTLPALAQLSVGSNPLSEIPSLRLVVVPRGIPETQLDALRQANPELEIRIGRNQ